ncbi:hypothetical protein Y1Q_0019506 [Alligator mississippiensis]|uniref:Uncharacterized protein n=1 Tax=Alligator mississippiensis TaxID=8496 RepID=A0A151NMM0_ALLMI|nr:hypothetical protein Y1Q_0019506 [Alligator mississippiensis]
MAALVLEPQGEKCCAKGRENKNKSNHKSEEVKNKELGPKKVKFELFIDRWHCSNGSSLLASWAVIAEGGAQVACSITCMEKWQERGVTTVQEEPNHHLLLLRFNLCSFSSSSFSKSALCGVFSGHSGLFFFDIYHHDDPFVAFCDGFCCGSCCVSILPFLYKVLISVSLSAAGAPLLIWNSHLVWSDVSSF